jgi:peptidoglycan/LPS O-acetylase OafA/YrhL
MRSSGGVYFERLDHVRALAALLVFLWHFVHNDAVVGYGYAPLFPLILLAQGHIGVSLFMTLSGYLFARLLLDRRIAYGAFLWNRALRLAPLLVVALAISALQNHLHGQSFAKFFHDLLFGFVLPTWPAGAWSIAIELQFYLCLPFVLRFAAARPERLLYAVAAAILLRWTALEAGADLRDLAYFTIVGRADQFLIGIMAHALMREARLPLALLVTGGIFFAVAYWSFTKMGAIGVATRVAPVPVFAFDTAWVFLPTFEGLLCAGLILAYERASIRIPEATARALNSIGTCSYSIYLLHPFIVVLAARAAHDFIYAGDNYYVVTALGLAAFLMMWPIAWTSFRLIEEPFLRYRWRYVAAARAAPSARGAAPIATVIRPISNAKDV